MIFFQFSSYEWVVLCNKPISLIGSFCNNTKKIWPILVVPYEMTSWLRGTNYFFMHQRDSIVEVLPMFSDN